MFPPLVILACALCVSGKLVSTYTFNKFGARKVNPSPTISKNQTGTQTIVATATAPIHTVIPNFQGNKVVSNGTNSADDASGFGTLCCGWGGMFGWTGQGQTEATMNGLCGPGLPFSTLDLNLCLSWDPNTGFVSCPSGGGFLSNSNSGCHVITAPSVLGNAFNAPVSYTEISIVCNGPAANTAYMSVLDLNSCIGVTDSGQLTC
ncbi:hypothetical protein D9613_002457 [Agrocybe pediades]|uniref:Cyanovirin-N domain-containing protein n=1 Tax=Agrocybe pediades TaxID=84607 RepID=A0A8H4VM18_9AGAR|nr:hypothetical protein D9613_002457 [Agrocybe pediades]